MSDHNSSETRKVVENINPDVGIILGSRIINDNIIKMFNLGVKLTFTLVCCLKIED